MHQSIALNAIRSGANMASPTLRTRASTGTLRAKRSLVSIVLMNRDVYDNKNVQELKTELKQRGITTSGKRKDLIERLLDSDGRSAKVFPTSDISNAMQKRNASTQSTSSSSSSSDNVKPETAHNVVDVSGKATVSHPPHIEPGQVSSNSHDSIGDIVKEKVFEAPPTAPGVPPEKAPQVPVTFEVKIPYEKVVEVPGPVIPLMTGYFHPETPLFTGFNGPDDGPIAHLPKVMTVSGEATYPGGGPSHHHANFDGPDISRGDILSEKTTVPEEQTISSAISSMFKSMRSDLGFSVDPATEKSAKVKASSAVSSTSSIFKEAKDVLAARMGSLTSSSGSGSASYSTSSYSGGTTRPMNDEETRGLYVLAGILGAGFLLGGATKPSKKQLEKTKIDVQKRGAEGKAGQ